MLSTVPHIETSFRVIIFRSWERIKQLDCLIYLYLCLRNWRSMTSFYGRAGGIWWLLDGASLSCALPDKMAKEETRFDQHRLVRSCGIWMKLCRYGLLRTQVALLCFAPRQASTNCYSTSQLSQLKFTSTCDCNDSWPLHWALFFLGR